MEKVVLSVVVPVYQGGLYLDDLVAELAEARRSLQAGTEPVELAEVIFVDDDSIDDSAGRLEEIRRAHDWVTVLHLSRNFGQHPATVAGVLHSSGDWVATLDEDLQHRPRHLLPLLMEAAGTGSDLVYARPTAAVHRFFGRDLASRLIKRITARLTGNPHVALFNSFRMIRGSVARAAASIVAHDTYFDSALSWFTTRVSSLPVEMVDRRSREGRRSGYSFWGLLAHARRMVMSAELKILRLGATIGVLALCTAVVGSLYYLARRLLGFAEIDPRGWTSLFLAVLFFGGLTAFLAGSVLEFLTTIVLSSKGKPTFFAVDRRKDRLLVGERADAEG